ncbi:hypothetical protein PVK06_014754 [Gossypium arboreum]|uniref:Uncharacterized protein n=1 Tax=Gossypium arboreum TaxID=29729 RepID=A0ABR0PVU1_GOSAR|nr:hypothetical protein PVK06_014754 [Gossypium arboreum]
MWRRLLIPQLKTLATVPRRSPSKTPLLQFKCSVSPLPSSSLLTRHLAAGSVIYLKSILSMGYPILISCFCFLFDWLYTHVKKRVEDVMPIATGHEREELAAELEGKKILEDVNNPVGPFGTKVKDEHDGVWFWLEKGKLHECPVCSQYFVLEVVGPGGPPDGHGDDHHLLQLSCSYWNKIGVRWNDVQ